MPKRAPRHIAILAGGHGERLWPASRRHHPKHLLTLGSAKTLLESTVARAQPLMRAGDHLWVIGAQDHARALRRVVRRCRGARLVLEPEGRNTAAAVALAAHLAGGSNSRGTMLVLPADHVIGRAGAWRRSARTALRIAEDDDVLVTFGILPSRPETGYGYLHLGAQHGPRAGVHRVRRFVEKPSAAVAKRYVRSRRYHWNSGMFAWRVSTISAALTEHLPALWRRVAALPSGRETAKLNRALMRTYPKLQNISIDYGVMERANNVVSVATDCAWNDVGSWLSAADVLSAGRARQNVEHGDVVTVDSRGNILVSYDTSGVVGTVGVENMVVVRTRDAVLVCPVERVQDVKQLVQQLDRQRTRQYV